MQLLPQAAAHPRCQASGLQRKSVMAAAHIAGVPLSVLTDSYKATHYLQYPKAQKMVAYGEFRVGYAKDDKDTRMVAYGIRYLIENYIAKQWTMQDIENADTFYRSGLHCPMRVNLCSKQAPHQHSAACTLSTATTLPPCTKPAGHADCRTHMAPLYTEFPFPRSIFEQFVKENNGWFPVKIQALPEGTVTHCRVPVYQVRGQAPATTAATAADHHLQQRRLRLHQA
ncbi:uncharacterized protein HaLaN_13859, partial [Haematococcus lacustris]